MEYPVPANLTTNGFTIGWNRVLSDGDKAFIREMYPPRQTDKNLFNTQEYASGMSLALRTLGKLSLPIHTPNHQVWLSASTPWTSPRMVEYVSTYLSTSS